jgi:uncharacterized membrane protein required for colicin V production
MPIDIILIAVFGYGFWQGYSRGIIGTVFNVLAYVFGITLAFKITPTTTNLLERLFNSDNPFMYVAAFVVNVTLIMFILRQAAGGMEGAFRAAYLGTVNQLLGGLLTAFLMVVVYSVLLWFVVKVQFVNEATLAESRTYQAFLKDLPGRAKEVAVRFKPMATDLWNNSLSWMDRLEKYGVEKTENKPKIYEIPDDGTGIEDEPEAAERPRAKPAASDSGIE